MSVSLAGGDATLLELQQPVEVGKVQWLGEHLGGPATREGPRKQVTDERLVVHYQCSHASSFLESTYFFLQLAVAQHLEDDVAAADELAADEHLRNRRPRRHVDQR